MSACTVFLDKKDFTDTNPDDVLLGKIHHRHALSQFFQSIIYKFNSKSICPAITSCLINENLWIFFCLAQRLCQQLAGLEIGLTQFKSSLALEKHRVWAGENGFTANTLSKMTEDEMYFRCSGNVGMSIWASYEFASR